MKDRRGKRKILSPDYVMPAPPVGCRGCCGRISPRVPEIEEGIAVPARGPWKICGLLAAND